jgi:hypothetical protein
MSKHTFGWENALPNVQIRHMLILLLLNVSNVTILALPAWIAESVQHASMDTSTKLRVHAQFVPNRHLETKLLELANFATLQFLTAKCALLQLFAPFVNLTTIFIIVVVLVRQVAAKLGNIIQTKLK